MARPRTGEKEKALVESAIRLFLQNGVRGTTIQDIARDAGMAVGTVYVYYQNKHEIVRRVAYAFAEQHHEFARAVLSSRRRPLAKLKDYVLGFYDMWQPFGESSRGPIELAEAVLRHAPETPAIGQAEFINTVKQILVEGKTLGWRVENPAEEARWIALCTAAFFPLAGTAADSGARAPLTRKDLRGLLGWFGRKLR